MGRCHAAAAQHARTAGAREARPWRDEELLGIAARAFFTYVFIGLVLPWFGLDPPDLARWTAAPDLPAQALAWFTAAWGSVSASRRTKPQMHADARR